MVTNVNASVYGGNVICQYSILATGLRFQEIDCFYT